MPNAKRTSSASLSCTAFNHGRRIASGPYDGVALSLKSYERAHPDASVLVFDDTTGAQIDFDLSGSDDDVKARLQQRFSPPVEAEAPRAPGRPKLGVVAREVTLLPRHWEWLAEQPGGASVDSAQAGGGGTARRLCGCGQAARPARAGLPLHVGHWWQSPAVRGGLASAVRQRHVAPEGARRCVAQGRARASPPALRRRPVGCAGWLESMPGS